jgi:hypothetical protein
VIGFAWGALAALSLVAGLFFLRFWKTTRDRLFLAFSLAFAVFAVHWTCLTLGVPPGEDSHYAYALRFLAFLLIVWGVIDKNRRAS